MWGIFGNNNRIPMMKTYKILLTSLLVLVSSLGFSQSVPSYVPTNGLVGWWGFNGNAQDGSGNGNHGTVNGATLTTDRFGNQNSAYDFDGVNDWIESYLNYGRNFSLSYWINSGAYKSYSGQIGAVVISSLSNGLSWPNNWESLFVINGSTHGFGNGSVGVGAGNVLQNTWYNIICTYDSATMTMKVFNNGTQTNFNNSFVYNKTTNRIVFGGRANTPVNYFFEGKLDDIGIWNRALTQQEITNLFNGCQLAVNTQPANQTININNNAQFIVGSSDTNATYQWQTDLGVGFQNLNSVLQYSGTTNDTLTVSNVTMSNNNQPFRCIVSFGSCSDTSNVAVLAVNNNVGINETSQDKLFSVFPNPTQSLINVKVDTKLIGNNYSIYDNTGKVVLSGKLKSENTTIDLGNLSGGLYMLMIGDNMKQNFKIIKSE